MRNRMKAMIAGAILVAAVATASSKVYLLREYVGGAVLWNANEAYFLVDIIHEGLPVSLLRYPWFFVKAYLGASDLPDDERASLLVIRVTSSGVEHHVLKLEGRTYGNPGRNPYQYSALDDHIYANCPPLDGLCRWAGDHFEPATPEERRRLDGINRLAKGETDKGENGWSKRQFGAGPADLRLTIDVGDNFRLSVNNVGTPGTQNGVVSIDLLRPGKPLEKIGEFNPRVARVTKA